MRDVVLAPRAPVPRETRARTRARSSGAGSSSPARTAQRASQVDSDLGSQNGHPGPLAFQWGHTGAVDRCRRTRFSRRAIPRSAKPVSCAIPASERRWSGTDSQCGRWGWRGGGLRAAALAGRTGCIVPEATAKAPLITIRARCFSIHFTNHRKSILGGIGSGWPSRWERILVSDRWLPVRPPAYAPGPGRIWRYR